MGCFEPTRQTAEYADLRRPRPAVIPAALRLPKAGQATRMSQGRFAARLWQEARPQADMTTLASFVRLMHQQGILVDQELGRELAQPERGLFELSDLACQRVGQHTRLPSLNREELAQRLDGAPAIERSDVATLARRGADVGLYDADTLEQAIVRMDVLESQFPVFWWKQIGGRCANGTGDGSDLALDAEFHSDSDGVSVTVHLGMPVAHMIRIPGHASEEDTLVRDMLVALVEVFHYATTGTSPNDVAFGMLPLEEDLDSLKALMDGPFTAEGLATRMRAIVVEQLGGAVEEDGAEEMEDADVFAYATELHDLITPMYFGDLDDWCAAMSALSQEGHWLSRSITTYADGASIHDERLSSALQHCRGLVSAVRAQHADRYPSTLSAADAMLEVVQSAIGAENPSAHHIRDYDDESLPIFHGVISCWEVVGGVEQFGLNSIYNCAMEESINYSLQSGMM